MSCFYQKYYNQTCTLLRHLFPLLLAVVVLLFNPEIGNTAPCSPPAANDTTIISDCDGPVNWQGGFLTVGSQSSRPTISATTPRNAVNIVGNTTTLTNYGELISDEYGFYSGLGFNTENIINKSGGIITGYNGILLLSGSASSVGMIDNNSGGLISAAAFAIFVSNNTSIGSIENQGIIRSYNDNGGIGNAGTIRVINNYNDGIIENAISSVSDGVIGNFGSGVIGVINNYGTMRDQSGSSILTSVIYNSSEITTINNFGSLSTISNALGSVGIFNDNNAVSVFGEIKNLINAQGGNGSNPSTTALTYAGKLPTNYYIAISNSAHYGQLDVKSSITPVTGSMIFGVYSGSTLSKFKQSYGSVLSGVSSSHLANTTGSVSGRNWRLISRGNDTYDLEIDSYFNLINNYRGLTSNRDALLGAMHERYAVLNAVSQYDCNRFDKYGVCISMQSRATGWGSQTTGAGVFNIAYRPHPNVHAGVYLDYQVAQATPFGSNLGSGGIQYGYNNPTFGGYVGFSQSGYNGTAINAGLQASMSGGYNPGKVTVTRAMLDGTEPGQGTADLNAYYAYGTMGYGFNLAEKTIAVPYAGLLYTNVIRNSYTENANYLVQAPLGYNAFYEQLLTGVFGGRIQSMITDKLGANIGAGAQFDLTRNANSYSGYSYIDGMDSFGIAHGGAWNGARPTGQAGVFYNVTKNEQLLLNAYAGQQAYTTRTYTSLVAGYQVSF